MCVEPCPIGVWGYAPPGDFGYLIMGPQQQAKQLHTYVEAPMESQHTTQRLYYTSGGEGNPRVLPLCVKPVVTV